jgi:hypothetical protein
MSAEASAAWAAWAAAAISLAGAGLSARFNKRDMRIFEREQEPKFTATFSAEPTPRIIFTNVDQEDFTEVSIFLDTKRTDRAVMSAFAEHATTVTIDDFPRRTHESFEIVRRNGVSGPVYFVCVCQSSRNRALTTRLVCEIEVPPIPYAVAGPLMARESDFVRPRPSSD